ncbi:MAG: TonB-dependent receptor, partial [Terriglobia bacterium]
MRSSLARVVLFLFTVVAVAVTPALAQLTTGSVSGTVVDPTGAVIPGATVTLTNEATGVTREVQTNQVGTFVIDRVRTGSYTLRITVSGFRTFETRDLSVSVGKVSGLGTVTMEVGAATEVVEVEMGTIPLVQADSPEIVGRYESRVVADVMWGSFGLDALSFLTAGVVPGFGNINTNSGGFGAQIGGDGGAAPAAAGQRARSTQFSMDGHEINDISIGGPSIFLDNLDTVEEYQVSVNSFDAASGRLPGAQVNVITKSGTNDIHGSIFYFYEANSLRSKTAAEAQTDESKPKEIQQPFGFTVGGPLIKNKWFGFGSYRRVDIPGGALATTTSLALQQPSAVALAAATGTNSTAVYAANGPFARPLGNPRCRTATQTTLTNFGGSGVDVDACGVNRDIAQSEVLWEYSLRMDVVTDTAGTFTGRWFDQFDDFCCTTFGGTAGFVTGVPFRGQSLNFGHTYQFTPRAINDFRFSYGRFFVAFEGGNTFPVSSFSDNLTRVNMPPGFLDFGLFTNIPQGRLLYNFQYQDNFSYTFGRHTVKMGLEYRRNRTSAPFLPDANGQFNFGNTRAPDPADPTATVVVADGLTNFVNNISTSTEFTSGAFSFQPFETDQFYYVQDDFRIRPNFVLNIGLRYEHTGQPINRAVDEVVKRESDPTTALFLQALPLDQRTIARVSNDDNNWGPRIGFTYTPRFAEWLFGEEKSVIRGGYGIAYEAAFYNILLNITTRAPRVFGFTIGNGTCTDVTCTVSNLGIGIPGDGTGNAVANAIPVPVNTFDPREFGQTNVP